MPDLDLEFPHRAIFESPIAYGRAFEDAPFFSKASLDNIRDIIPYKEANLEENIDLLGIGGNMCSVGLANKNDDVMDAQTAVNVARLFKNKFINKEHDRNKIIGHVVTVGFSDFEDNRLISAEEALAYGKPFHISTGGVIYKMVDRSYAELIEKSTDPESPIYGELSYSWEIGLKKFGLAIGSKNLSEATIVTDENQVNELKKFLRVYGGSGKTNHDEEVYRLVFGECYPLGGGVVSNPAGRMKTGLVSDNLSQKTSIAVTNPRAEEIFKKNCVTNYKPMDPKLEALLQEIVAAHSNKKVTEEISASIQNQIKDAIKSANDEYVEKVSAAEKAKAAAEKELADLKASQEKTDKELAEAKQALEDLQNKAIAQEAAETFSARMDYFVENFDLDEDDRQILAKDLGELPTDEDSFAAYKDKMGKLMKSKSKSAKEKAEKEMKAAIAKAAQEKLSTLAKAGKFEFDESELEKLLDETKASEAPPPNNDEEQGKQETLRERYSKAFSKDHIVIS